MPQAANIVIGEDAIPTNVTFKPKSVGDIAVLQDDLAATIAGRPNVTLSHRLAKGANPAKTRLVITVPVEETVDSVVGVARSNTIIIDVLTSPDSLLAEPSALRYLASNLLLDPTVISMIDDGERVW